MCGITGLFHYANGKYKNAEITEVINKMTATLISRGPDAHGIFQDEKIALGHQRLKIIDTSNNAAQPMQLRENGPVLVYNGEIYNFQSLKTRLSYLGHNFKSSSDTEVILRQYDQFGLNGLKNLEGIFAFALWDPSDAKLILMRDRLGVKPLYFAKSAFGLAFGSEIKAVLAAGGIDVSLNDQAFCEYLWYGNAYEDRSFYNGVKSMMPGQCLILDGDSERRFYWWQVEDWLESSVSEMPEHDATNSVQLALDASLKRQLVSDVPLGIFLSGGIDSSAIAASAIQSGLSNIRSFSASFDFDKGIDESAKAAQVANHLGLEHKHLRISGSNITETLMDMVRAHDEPFADAANIPLYLMCKTLDPEIKVVLQGDGGDELFAGYRRYQILSNPAYFKYFPKILSNILNISGSLGRRASRIIDAMSNTDPAIKMGLLLTLETLRNNPSTLLKVEKSVELDNSADPFLAYRNAAERFKKEDPVQKMLLTDLTVQLPCQFLNKVDRATMAAGIEARVPLLDENLLRIAIGMNFRRKVNRNQDKIILRNSQKSRLPSKIVNGAKTGFGVPYEFWLRTSLFDFTQERLLDTKFLDYFGFKIHAVEKKINEHREQICNNGFILWKLLQLALWLELQH